MFAILWFALSMWCSYMCVKWIISLCKPEPQYVYVPLHTQIGYDHPQIGTVVQQGHDQNQYVLECINQNLMQMNENIAKLSRECDNELTFNNNSDIIVQNTLKSLGIDEVKYD